MSANQNTPLLCLGPSQWPLIKDGQKITITPFSPTSPNVRLGELVVYVAHGRRICHRLIAKRVDSQGPLWLVKGDANPWPDGWIRESQMIGAVHGIDGKSLDRFAAKLVARILYFQGRFSFVFYTAFFANPIGRAVGNLRKMIFPFPLFGRVLSFLVSPGVWGQKGSLARYLHFDTPEHRRMWFFPPEVVGVRLRRHRQDYGHAPFYRESLHEAPFYNSFGEFDPNGDVDSITNLFSGVPISILDLAGGSGKLSEQLVREGHQVTLVDKSRDMLAFAKKRRKRFSPEQQKRWTIVGQSITALDLPEKFDAIVSLNNGLEHVGNHPSKLKTLHQLKKHLTPRGRCYIDIHHTPTLETSDAWKTGRWVKKGCFTVGNKRVWLFGRTFPGPSTGEVISEHALTSRFIFFTWCQTSLYLGSFSDWQRLFTSAGWKFEGAYSSWKKQPLAENRARTVFELSVPS